MTETSANLPLLQRWMQAVIQHPGGVMAGMMQPAAQAALKIDDGALSQVIEPSSKQTSAQRLQVYADAYFARLLEVLTHEYPALHHALGAELFAGFALGYLQAYPSTSYTLGMLGARFPEYLATTRPARSTVDPDWTDFLIDCARLERLYAEVFDGPGPERSAGPVMENLSDLTPQELAASSLQFAPSVHVIALQFPVQEYISAVRRGDSPEIPAAAPTWIVVTRRDYRVRRVPISEAESALLTELQRGTSVGAALQMLGTLPKISFDAADIERWFRNWTAAGYIRGVQSAQP